VNIHSLFEGWLCRLNERWMKNGRAVFSRGGLFHNQLLTLHIRFAVTGSWRCGANQILLVVKGDLHYSTFLRLFLKNIHEY